MGYSLLGSGIFDKGAKLGVVDALLLAVIGTVIVFLVLAALMLIVTLFGKAFDGSESLKKKHPEWADKIAATKSAIMFWKKNGAKQEKSEEVAIPANGTYGELTLVNVSERDAAMIMAIVADNTGTPLNELRFKSIKRLEDDKK